ncbi:Zinc finger protein [Paragonimus heterotremus]|uniref:Zinc finger protein 830 n=1 Tax=Paragonimus heterotremus TaxID=100268 RepID=A0A8J4SIH2_9TREM|nr:Zinc finger protein [Paragonimus heterotremus]
MKAADFLPKSDVRQLIKATKNQTRKIDHPHARYNQLGRISCIVCGIQIKSELAWNAHVISKTHKQNEARDLSTVPKRLLKNPVQSSASDAKLPRLEDQLINSNVVEDSRRIDPVTTGEKNPAEKTREVSNSKLPEGFFDDAYKDAKVRNVPYKDKLTEEVELFQKEMNALEKQSEDIMEKESEAMVTGRELDELDTQIQKWEKIQQLQEEKEILELRLKEKLVRSAEQPDSEVKIKHEPTTFESDDDSEDSELYDFRAKKVV